MIRLALILAATLALAAPAASSPAQSETMALRLSAASLTSATSRHVVPDARIAVGVWIDGREIEPHGSGRFVEFFAPGVLVRVWAPVTSGHMHVQAANLRRGTVRVRVLYRWAP